MQVAKMNSRGAYNAVYKIVTSAKGSWRWQDAFRKSTYEPMQKKDGSYMWVSVATSQKFAKTKSTREKWSIGSGSLHQKAAKFGTDDYGNLFFVVE